MQWRHNERDGVSNHQPHHCLLNRLFGCRSKKTSKLLVTGLCEGNSPVTGAFPTQVTSNAENVSIWWRHHVCGRWRTFDWLFAAGPYLLVELGLSVSSNWVISIIYNGNTLHWAETKELWAAANLALARTGTFCHITGVAIFTTTAVWLKYSYDTDNYIAWPNGYYT